MANSKFKISLRENGEHSLKKSLESYNEYERTKDQMLLKDTILFLHNGIELLMKEMLARENEFLIFEDLKDVSKKQTKARIMGIDIFFIDNPPKTVTYEEAYTRVEAFINPPELDNNLKEHLRQLNRLRNQLEHYAIEIDIKEVISTLEAIHELILKLFEKRLGPLTLLQTPQINQALQDITKTYETFKQKNHEISNLMRKFNGQKVPGFLFGVDDEVVLPKFDSVSENELINVDGEDGSMSFQLDILAKSAGLSTDKNIAKWIVETKLRRPPINVVHQLNAYAQITSSVPWLIVFDRVPHSSLFEAKKLNVMITGLDEYEKLKHLVMPKH